MKRTVLRRFLVIGLAVMMLAALPSQTHAAFPYVFGGPAAIPIPGPGLPSPLVVPGKEFSNFPDRDFMGLPDPEQVIAWDGNPFGPPKGGIVPEAGVLDTFDYSGTRPPPTTDGENDAIANLGDALFTSLYDPDGPVSFPNATNLLYSVGSLSVVPPPVVGPIPSGVGLIGGTGDISFERPSGAHGIWASGPVDIDSMTPPRDVDGLEVWGPQEITTPIDDANRYSLDVDAITGVSVWAFDGAATSSPYIFKGVIDAVVLGLLGPLPMDVDIDDIDLDAMMVLDTIPSEEFGPGDSIIFSIDQIPTLDPIDPDGFYATGGEIFTLTDLAGGIASGFLFHGGHFWDHTFGLTTFVDSAGIPLNINALEAASVPEPSGIVLCLLGLIACCGSRWRRRVR